MDYQQLSEMTKEDLISFIQSQQTIHPIKDDNEDESVPTEIDNSSTLIHTVPAYTECQFRPRRGNNVCSEPPKTLWGFCQKHSRTLQSKEAEVEYRKLTMPATHIEETPIEEPTHIEEPSPIEEPHIEEPHVIDDSSSENSEYEREMETIEEKENEKVKKRKKSKLVLRPNYWGRYEDMETGILFDPAQKKAYGIQDRTTGRALSLTPYHIEMCEDRGWPYMIPKEFDESEDEYDESDESEEESTEESTDEDTSDEYEDSD